MTFCWDTLLLKITYDFTEFLLLNDLFWGLLVVSLWRQLAFIRCLLDAGSILRVLRV